MTNLKVSASDARPRAVVIADLVGSRRATDRRRVHARVAEVLAVANDRLGPLSPLRVTVGDEYQGAFADVGSALRATTWLRLELAVGDPVVDVRHGVGWGTAAPLQDDPPVEDGPAWWVARDALERVEARSRRGGTATRRTGFAVAPGHDDAAPDPAPDPALVEALLVCQDLVLGSLSTRSTRLLHGLLAGRTQIELAEVEGVSASAVSQRIRRDGLASVLEVDAALQDLREGGGRR